MFTLFTSALSYWKSIIYEETIYCLRCLLLFLLFAIAMAENGFCNFMACSLFAIVIFVYILITSQSKKYNCNFMACSLSAKMAFAILWLVAYLRKWLRLLLKVKNIIAILWLVAYLRKWLRGQNYFCIWTWLYILYIRGTQALRQGPNS